MVIQPRRNEERVGLRLTICKGPVITSVNDKVNDR